MSPRVSVTDTVVSLATANSLAKPKSRTFACPFGVTITLAGFRSRWITPCSWASSSASAISMAIEVASFTVRGPDLIFAANDSPGTHSITM